MSALAKALVAGRHQRLICFLLLAGIFTVLLAIGYGFVNWQVASLVAQDQRAELARTDGIRHNAAKALQVLQRDATALPCSGAFLAQMQHIAFLADGLNEFLYAPGGYASCSTSRASFPGSVSLGPEDIAPSGPEKISWRLQRNLGPIGLTDAVGTIAQIGDFAVAIPPYGSNGNKARWLSKELIARSGDQVWTIAGRDGLYKELTDKKPEKWKRRLTTVSSTACDAHGVHCVASRANLIGWARSSITILSSTVVLTAMFAWICAFTIVRWLREYWSFEARFLRRLDTQSVLVLYQPIVDINSDQVACVEALARWVDVDGTVVSPVNFIDIVAKANRTAEFTQMVADRAFADLNEHPPCAHPLEINFNVFACDFDSGLLLKIFAKFLNQPHRFRVAIELIEFHDIDLEKAQATVEALAAAGVKTYIDDFGTGYSSIERVARLPVDGVKLDRSFAMSPPDSIMGRMLVQVIEMVKTTGRSIIVEGVESLTRLNLLRATGIVGYVQGYVIAPPLEIEALRAFMLRGNAAWKADDVAA
ncbi:MAG TPA: EAL domain-containing protein [Hyphomicrobium sp.]|nr:EAL domain-containing protein [Hyphomicrobium sp.]